MQCQVEKISDQETIIRFRSGCWHTLFDWLLLGATLVALFIASVIAGGALSLLAGSLFLHQSWLPSEWWRDVIFIFGLYAILVSWFLARTWPGTAAVTVTPEGIKWEEHQVAFGDMQQLSVTSDAGDRYSELVLLLTNKARASIARGWTKGTVLRDVRETILESSRSMQPEQAPHWSVLKR